ncbi:MAG: hypothetical protein IPM88_06100 [Nitrospira sp.]|nr:hypothetical protein [Nitrospira sp.]
MARLTINTPDAGIGSLHCGRPHHLADVVDTLGAPDSITDTETGTIVTYRFLNAKYSRVNFGWLLKPWSPVDPDLVFSRSGLGTDAFELLCDDQWIVTHHAFVRHRPAPPFTPYPF